MHTPNHHHMGNKTPPNKNLQVEFAQLNENNKSEFLQFLLKNNISFEKCNGNDNGNYIAKVTITKDKNIMSNKNQQEKKMENRNKYKGKDERNHNSSLSVSKNLSKSIKMITPQKQNTTPLRNVTTINNFQQSKLHKPKQNLNLIDKHNNIHQKTNSGRSISTKNRKEDYLYGPKSVRTTQFETEDYSLTYSKDNLKENTKLLNTKDKRAIKSGKQDLNKDNNNGNRQSILRQKSKQNTNKSISLSAQKIQFIEKQKITEVNNKIRKQTQLQKQITQLVNRYLKLFDLKLQGQRPIRWPLVQLVKTIQEIYDWIFLKNTQNLTQKGLNHKEYQSTSNSLFVKLIKQFFTNKLKNDKLANSNLINMLYSLSLYLENEKKLINQSSPSFKTIARELKTTLLMTATGVFMQTFEDFLCQLYQFEDLLFYLFVRSIIVNEIRTLNQTKGKSQKQSNKKAIINQTDLIFGTKELNKILRQILGDDDQLLEEYTQMIVSHVKSQRLYQSKENLITQSNEVIKISSPQFIALLIQDYKKKRLIMQQQAVQFGGTKLTSIENYSITSDNTFQSLLKKGFPKYKDKQEIKQVKSGNLKNQNDTNQLTFGEQTQQNIQELLSMHENLEMDRQFWEPYIQSREYHKYEANSIEELICQKMKKKVKQFISILIENRTQYNSLQKNGQNKLKSQPNKKNLLWLELLLRKSLNLLNSIIDMNKLQWFEELKVTDPTQQDIDQVQKLQLAYRRVKENPQAEEIGKICKNILTTPQLTSALEKLISFEGETSTNF